MLQWWSDEDRVVLKQLYPEAEKEEILKALNGQYKHKTWSAIQKEASRLKITRDSKFKRLGPPKKKLKTFLGKKQLSVLLAKDYDIDKIAQKLRADPDIVRRYIHKYEL